MRKRRRRARRGKKRLENNLKEKNPKEKPDLTLKRKQDRKENAVRMRKSL